MRRREGELTDRRPQSNERDNSDQVAHGAENCNPDEDRTRRTRVHFEGGAQRGRRRAQIGMPFGRVEAEEADPMQAKAGPGEGGNAHAR